MQDSSTRTGSMRRALSSAEREWIRRQGRVARAIEAAQRRNCGRFSRVASPAQAMGANTRTPA